MLNGLAKAISKRFLNIVGRNLYFRTASEKAVPGLTAQQLRGESDVHQQSGW
jgi:hypothetical protein